MTGDLFDRLREIIVVAVDAVLLPVRGGGLEHAADVEDAPQLLADIRVVGYLLSDDIHRAVYRVLRSGDLFLGINKTFCIFQRVEALFLLEYLQREGLKPALLGDRGPCLSLGSERAVDVLQLAQGLSFVQSRADLIRQLLLTGDQLAYLFSALVERTQMIQLLAELADELIVHRAVHLFTVAGDERDGVAVVEQSDDILRVLLFDIE